MNIIIIGELFEDQFIYCHTNRMSQEAPVPILIQDKFLVNYGGAGNVLANCVNIQPLAYCEIIHQPERIVKTRYIDQKSNHMFIRIDEEPPVTQLILTNDMLNKIKEADIVIVSDYNKGFISDKDLEFIALNSKLSILDSKRILSKDIIEAYDFVKLNEEESKQNIYSDNILITLGEKGCMYQNIHYGVTAQQTIDVSGAGDTFTAAFILKYNLTENIRESIKFANMCAGKVVNKKGIAVPF